MEVKKVIENYLEEVELKKCKATYQCYCSHLNCFYEFCICSNYLTVDSIDKNFYLKYLKYSRDKNLCAKTINKRFRLFLLACKKNKIILDLDHECLKEKNVRFDVLNEDSLKKIINYCYHLSEDEKDITNKMLILLLLDTGARINELLNIKISNIDFEKNKILLTVTKTNTDRIVYFNKYTSAVIKESLKMNRNNSDYLLFNFKAMRPYTYDCSRSLFRNMKKELNIIKLHPHMFRHTFITNLINNGAPVFLVQQLAGHVSIKTTQIYVHQNEKKLEECYQQYSSYGF